MVKSSVDTDPVSGLPTEHPNNKKKIYDAQKQKLKDQARFSSVASSDAAKVLRQMIREKLHGRIEQILSDDPEAKAFTEMLKALDVKGSMATRALAELYKLGEVVNP